MGVNLYIPKETDQILIEELFKEIPSLNGFKYSDARKDIDSDRRTIWFRNKRDEAGEIRFLPDGSLAGHTKAIMRALIDYDPSILDDE